MTKKPLCIIAGVGPGNGLAFCNKFYDAGYRVVIVSRKIEQLKEYANDREEIFPYACDLSEPDNINNVFTKIINDQGAPEIVIYNAGSGLFATPLEVKLEDFEGAWKINALGLLSVAKIVAPLMIENGGGCLLVTGATASLRGGAKFAAFASAKAAQRNLTQSLARSLGKKGIHVALVIIDGVIDMPRSRALFSDASDDAFMQPTAIAETYFNLSQQDKSAWTFELDLRSCNEDW